MRLKSIIVLLPLLLSCSPKVLPPVEQRIVTVQRDSVVLRDSVVITPIEQSSAVVLPKDTLLLETSLAKAEAYVSEDGLLKGNITNKKSIVEQIK